MLVFDWHGVFRALVLGLVLLGSACAKPNPVACCTTAADCEAFGVPEGRSCEEGLACVNNTCIDVSCEANSDCAPPLPVCSPQRSCVQCVGDTDCAGTSPFCRDDTCVQCRTSVDCPDSACDAAMGVCAPCSDNAQCASGLCNADGTCTPVTSLVFAAPNGVIAGDCTMQAPCVLERAIVVASTTLHATRS